MPDKIGSHLLGRKPSPLDPRDYKMVERLQGYGRPWYVRLWYWVLSLVVAEPPPPPPPGPAPDPFHNYVRHSAVQLDQGDTPHCVGFASAHWEGADPVEGAVTNSTGHDIYYLCKIKDGETGAEDGTYVRTAAAVLKSLSRLDAYYFADNITQIRDWLRTFGSVIMGTDWLEDMFYPDNDGYVNVSGSVAGGHSYIVLGDLTTEEAFLCQNSWGSEWGIGGRFKVKWNDMAQLLAAQGEACGAAELP